MNPEAKDWRPLRGFFIEIKLLLKDETFLYKTVYKYTRFNS